MLNSLNELVILHNSTHGVYFEILLEDLAKGLCYVNIHPTSIFLAHCSFGFFLCRLPSVAVFVSQIAALRTAAGSNSWSLWEGKYLAVFRVLSKLNRRR